MAYVSGSGTAATGPADSVVTLKFKYALWRLMTPTFKSPVSAKLTELKSLTSDM